MPAHTFVLIAGAWHGACVRALRSNHSGKGGWSMAIANAVYYLIALALPLWLVIEEIALHQRREMSQPRRGAVPSITTAPSPHTA